MKNKILLYLGDSSINNDVSGVGLYHRLIINSINHPFDIIFTKKPNDNSIIPSKANIILINKIIRKIIGLLKIFLPFNLFFPGYNIIITDGFTPIRFGKKLKIFTIIHDLMAITERKNYPKLTQLYNFIKHKTYNRANGIIAVSNNTKNELIRLLNIKENIITVIPNVRDFYVNRNSTEDYFIYIGEMRKNKNLNNTILGFIEYKNNFNSNTKLVICGNKKHEYNNLYELVCKNNFQDKILFTGYINDQEKEKYFSETKGLVLLSDNEGFGVPIIEAMMNYIPVLLSDIPIMHEVSNNTAIFVNHKDITEIAKGFEMLSRKIIDDTFLNACNEIKSKYSIENFKILINRLLESI